MSTIAIDTETGPIEPGILAPDLVCMQWSDDKEARVVGRDQTSAVFKFLCKTYETLVFHNAPYDIAVLATHDPSLFPLIIDLYEQDRIRDTQIREVLYHIRKGTLGENLSKVSLGALAWKYLGVSLDKGDDSWRLRYHELIDTPLDEWPEEALKYAKDDALYTWQVHARQESSPDELLQVRAHLGLHAMSCRGVRTNKDQIDKLEIGLLEEFVAIEAFLVTTPFVREDGTRDTKALKAYVDEKMDGRAPRTAPSKRFPDGQISTDADTLTQLNDPTLDKLVERSKIQKLLTTYVPALRRGVKHPLISRFNPLVSSGRTSCSSTNIRYKNATKKTDVAKCGTNLQNPPRKEGVRECYEAREGFYFASSDIQSAELGGLAQVCYTWFGESKLRDAIIEGKDLHLVMSANTLEISYEEAVRRYEEKDPVLHGPMATRQYSKIANFGFAGGMGARAFVDYARGYGIDVSVSRAKQLQVDWRETWSEVIPYFELISELTGDFGPRKITQLGSNRVRGNVGFCQAANGFFQSIIADACKDAIWEVFKGCYLESANSPLYGSFPVMFLHDELILEVPIETAHLAGPELARVLREVVQKWLPDVPVRTDIALMERWYKDASANYDKDGKLILWQPKKS